MIHKVLFEDDVINWGPAIMEYGYGMFLNVVSQFLITYYLFYSAVIPRFNALQFSQEAEFCNISSILKFVALQVFYSLGFHNCPTFIASYASFLPRSIDPPKSPIQSTPCKIRERVIVFYSS